LQQRLVATWAVIQHSVVYGVIDQWPKRLEACTNTEGGQSNTTGSFQSHQCQSTTQSRPTFERTQQIFSQMKKSCISQVSVVTHIQVGYIIIIIIIYSLKIGAGQQGRICGTYSCPQYKIKCRNIKYKQITENTITT